MRLSRDTSEVYVPDGLEAEQALARTTHLAIGAHQDDLEFMAGEPIIACYQQPDKWFTGVVVTDGRGSPRAGLYASYSDDDMHGVRRKEQRKAAFVGEYAAQVLLDHPSSAVKNGADGDPAEDLAAVLAVARPDVVYTHNLADKHDTHIGVAFKTIAALRSLPADQRPKQLVGCEVWRDLDWMCDDDKLLFDLSDHENLQASLMGVFDSQISGGKRYDLATAGRRRAHATYFQSHGTDNATGLSFGMDMTALIEDDSLDPNAFVQRYIQAFADEVRERLERMGYRNL
jgi:LmbE family N-acetylglucosaminyl deacetylase